MASSRPKRTGDDIAPTRTVKCSSTSARTKSSTSNSRTSVSRTGYAASAWTLSSSSPTMDYAVHWPNPCADNRCRIRCRRTPPESCCTSTATASTKRKVSRWDLKEVNSPPIIFGQPAQVVVWQRIENTSLIFYVSVFIYHHHHHHHVIIRKTLLIRIVLLLIILYQIYKALFPYLKPV